MKVLDVYPQMQPLVVRPICQAKLGPLVSADNAQRKAEFLRHRRRALKIPPDQCDSYARYQIDGAWFCRKHAALTLLDRLAVPA